MGIISYCRRRKGEELKRKKIQERMGIEGKWQMGRTSLLITVGAGRTAAAASH